MAIWEIGVAASAEIEQHKADVVLPDGAAPIAIERRTSVETCDAPRWIVTYMIPKEA